MLRRIIIAWLVTLPVTILIAGGLYYVFENPAIGGFRTTDPSRTTAELTMAIDPVLTGQAFDPKAIREMSLALDSVALV